jgi:hypothetical protein
VERFYERDASFTMKKRKTHLHRTTTTPRHEKLPWPGLKAKDHLSRVTTRAVKEARETRENETWAENQIAQVLDYVPPGTAIKLIFRGTRRRRELIRRLSNNFLRLLETVEGTGGIIEFEGGK